MIREHTMEQKIQRQFKRETNAYRVLAELVRDIPDFSRVERHAMAFIVENMGQQGSDTLGQNIEALRNELLQIKSKEGIPGLTWKLSQEFNRRYEAFLGQLETHEQDPARKKNLAILREQVGKDMKIRQQAYGEGRRVPIGSVILEHVPSWFK